MSVHESDRITPLRPQRRRRVTRSIFEWQNPEDVPGAILSPTAQRRLQERLRRLDEHVGRARVSARDYWIR